VADAKLAYYGSPTLTDLSVADNTDYMVTVRRNDAGGSFEWRLENMETGVVTTDSSLHGSNSGGTGLFNIGGNSTYSPTGTEISNLIVIESVADADVEECELYLRQYYRGVTAGTESSTAGKFLIELDIELSLKPKKQCLTISSSSTDIQTATQLSSQHLPRGKPSVLAQGFFQ